MPHMQNTTLKEQTLHIAGTFTAAPVSETLGNGIKSRSRKGDFCVSPRARSWVKIIEQDKTPQLIRKARMLARKGCITGLGADSEAVNACGISEKGDKLFIKFPVIQIEEQKKQALIKHIASNTLDSMMIFKNKLPSNISRLTKLLNPELLPLENAFNGSCTCEDWSLPCRHTMAAAYLLCEAFDYNPLLPLEIIGISKTDIYKKFCLKREIPLNDPDREFNFPGPLDFSMHQSLSKSPKSFKLSATVFSKGMPKQAREAGRLLDEQIFRLLADKKKLAPWKKAGLPMWEGCAEAGQWLEKLYKSVGADALKALDPGPLK